MKGKKRANEQAKERNEGNIIVNNEKECIWMWRDLKEVFLIDNNES